MKSKHGKNPEIEQYWRTVLGSDLLTRSRMSRIYYGGKFYDYPLRAGNAFRNMGLINTMLCVGDYIRAQLAPISPARSFEDWVAEKQLLSYLSHKGWHLQLLRRLSEGTGRPIYDVYRVLADGTR